MGKIAEDMVNGFACSWCGIYFEKNHGYAVICTECWKDYLHRYPGDKGDKKEQLRTLGLQVAHLKQM